jgi:hypothetical protein
MSFWRTIVINGVCHSDTVRKDGTIKTCCEMLVEEMVRSLGFFKNNTKKESR